MVGGSTKGYFLYNVVEKLKENPWFSVTFFELFLKFLKHRLCKFDFHIFSHSRKNVIPLFLEGFLRKYNIHRLVFC